MFKARFVGWDDVLAVDYTLSADYVAKASKQLGVTVRELPPVLFHLDRVSSHVAAVLTMKCD